MNGCRLVAAGAGLWEELLLLLLLVGLLLMLDSYAERSCRCWAVAAGRDARLAVTREGTTAAAGWGWSEPAGWVAGKARCSCFSRASVFSAVMSVLSAWWVYSSCSQPACVRAQDTVVGWGFHRWLLIMARRQHA